MHMPSKKEPVKSMFKGDYDCCRANSYMLPQRSPTDKAQAHFSRFLIKFCYFAGTCSTEHGTAITNWRSKITKQAADN